MFGAEVRRRSSTTIPLSTARPASRASSLRGTTPTPTTAKSHSTCAPSLSRTRATAVSLERLDAAPEQHLDPMCHMYIAVERSDLGPEDPFVRKRQRIDDG